MEKPFRVVQAVVKPLARQARLQLEQWAPYVQRRWAVTAVLGVFFVLRFLMTTGFYIVCCALP